MELLTKLGVDWKLLIAQIINFAILLWILRKFAYKPVLALLEKRRKMVEKTVEDSKEAETLLADIEKTRLEAIEKIKVQSVAMTEKAAQQAELVRAEILENAKKEAQLMFEQTQHQISLEKQKMLKEMEQEIARLIVAGASKILEREFSEADQKRLFTEAAERFASV